MKSWNARMRLMSMTRMLLVFSRQEEELSAAFIMMWWTAVFVADDIDITYDNEPSGFGKTLLTFVCFLTLAHLNMPKCHIQIWKNILKIRLKFLNFSQTNLNYTVLLSPPFHCLSIAHGYFTVLLTICIWCNWSCVSISIAGNLLCSL